MRAPLAAAAALTTASSGASVAGGGPSELTKASKCVPCEGIGSALAPGQVAELAASKTPAWTVSEDAKRLHRSWTRASFPDAMAFVNRVADVAEAEGHHPDIHITDWNRVRIELWTHALGGLTENDFIVAMKVDAVQTS